MIKNHNYPPEFIAEKQAVLESATQQLKSEFIGLDAVIDNVISSLTTWYLFPEIQERPLVINLWGMTGVGKTALVKRLAELLDYDKKLFRFDMGSTMKDSGSLKNRLKTIFRYNNSRPFILMMDEFQYAKTKDEDGCDVSNPFSRIIWDLLDSGKLESFGNSDNDMEKIGALKKRLTTCLAEGIQVVNGMVQGNEQVFLEIMDDEDDDDLVFGTAESIHCTEVNGIKQFSFLPTDILVKLCRYSPKKFFSIVAFRKLVYSMNGEETVSLLEKLLENGTSYTPLDCSKTLIFILGNLDDAYQMSEGTNPDINADEFHESSKEINTGHIKNSLKKRFKPEQIARLGNNHIIYPAFSQQNFRDLITLELNRVSWAYKKKFGIEIQFTEPFKNLIYQEGVYPTQGSRPLLSTIYQMVNTKIAMVIAEKILHAPDAETVMFHFKEGLIKYIFLTENREVHILEMPAELNLEKLRAPEQDDLQAITAVHEAGHAVVAMAASGILPEYICSTTADAESGGFLILKNRCKYMSKEMAINSIAWLCGGLLAEKLIFGESKITTGAEQDIERATELAAMMVKDYGMGKGLAKIDKWSYTNRTSYLDKSHEANAEVKSILEEGSALAEKLLSREKVLLLKLADYLSDERIIKKANILTRAMRFGSAELQGMPFSDDHSKLFYRQHLKQQAGQASALPQIANGQAIVLNKNM